MDSSGIKLACLEALPRRSNRVTGVLLIWIFFFLRDAKLVSVLFLFLLLYEKLSVKFLDVLVSSVRTGLTRYPTAAPSVRLFSGLGGWPCLLLCRNVASWRAAAERGGTGRNSRVWSSGRLWRPTWRRLRGRVSGTPIGDFPPWCCHEGHAASAASRHHVPGDAWPCGRCRFRGTLTGKGTGQHSPAPCLPAAR